MASWRGASIVGTLGVGGMELTKEAYAEEGGEKAIESRFVV